MYDIKPLENEWKKYQKNKRKPWIIAIFVFFIIGLISFYTFSYKSFYSIKLDNIKLFNIKNNSKVNTIYKNNGIINNALTSIETNNIKEEISIEKPMINDNILVDIPILDLTENVETSDDGVLKEKKKVYLNIVETSNISAYKDVERRFYESHDTDDSLFLAKSYYNKGRYLKAEYWAYETNKINASISESLFIFIKAKVKLGKKNEALSILSKYIKKTNSYKARQLLIKIENNQL